MINLEDHHHIELMLLLTNRCKANLNFSLYQIEHHYDYRLWESFHKQIASLKERVELKFDYYSELLTNYENKLSTIIKDKLHKIADKRGYKQKEKFLNGIEGLDFNVHQQIQFTCQKYISSIVDGLRTKDTEEKNVKRLLTAYADVALIRQEDLSTVSLSERIRQLFQGK